MHPNPVEILGDVIGLKKANREGANFFIKHPSQLNDLFKSDFMLLEDYFDNCFTPQDVNAIIHKTREKNKELYYRKNYVLIEQMVRLLISQSTPMPEEKVFVKNLSSSRSGIEKIIDIFNELTFNWAYCHQVGLNQYHYYYSNELIFTSAQKQTIETINANNVPYYSYDTTLEKAHQDWQSRQYVLTHLPQMLVNFLGKLEKSNTLDFEFTHRMVSYNPAFSMLSKNGHYQVVAALLKSISPSLAMEKLLDNVDGGKINDNTQTDVLQYLIEKLPQTLPAVAQAIECMQQLKFDNINDFETFIKIRKNYDLLQLFKKHSPGNSDLLDKFLAIEPNFLKEHFSSTAKDLPMPAEKQNPHPAASAPPHIDPPPYSARPAFVGGDALMRLSVNGDLGVMKSKAKGNCTII